ncbi:uncharacterized protein pit [Palaemon carinicauda]|uniref:uncharacterized protein pit n=1 Tax=Palaemon carinicauda TaxID=392227 RepID=UPI0035B58193
MGPRLPDKILKRKMKKAAHTKLKLLKAKEEGIAHEQATQSEPMPEDETERLILEHPSLSKRPAGDGEELYKKKKKKKLEAVEAALDSGADNEVQVDVKKKKKKKKKKENGELSESINSEGVMKSTSTDETEKDEDQNEGEETGYESEELTAGSSTLGFDSATSRSFESLRGSVSDVTLNAIEKMGFKTMTEIQAKAIPPLLEGKDLRGTAKTGAGKTLAFALPVVELLSTLQFKPRNGTGAIIISPTRELSMQTFTVLTELMQERSQTLGLIMGGADRKAEVEKLGKGINVLVATPGRLLDHLQHSPNFVYKNLVCLVIDEADRIFDVGFEEEMKQILRLLPRRRQTMLFSATKDNKTNELARLALNTEPMEVDVDSDKLQATVEGLDQAYLVCPADKRFLVLYTFLKKNRKKKVMVFFSSCMAVKFYYELLNYIDVPVLYIHGKQKQTKRTTNFYQFCNAESGILLCTDVAARGWDIPAVDWIVQYDPPDDPKEYIHRVGRTARAGGKGNALLFIREEEIGFITYLKAHKVNVDCMDITWSKVANIQPQLEKLMSKNYFLNASGKEAFKGYVRAYDSHQHKDIFRIETLDLKKTAKCFGFEVPPFVDIGAFSGKKTVRRGYRNYPGMDNKKINRTKIYRKEVERT